MLRNRNRMVEMPGNTELKTEHYHPAEEQFDLIPPPPPLVPEFFPECGVLDLVVDPNHWYPDLSHFRAQVCHLKVFKLNNVITPAQEMPEEEILHFRLTEFFDNHVRNYMKIVGRIKGLMSLYEFVAITKGLQCLYVFFFRWFFDEGEDADLMPPGKRARDVIHARRGSVNVEARNVRTDEQDSQFPIWGSGGPANVFTSEDYVV